MTDNLNELRAKAAAWDELRSRYALGASNSAERPHMFQSDLDSMKYLLDKHRARLIPGEGEKK